jgi:hypothetical protein
MGQALRGAEPTSVKSNQRLFGSSSEVGSSPEVGSAPNMPHLNRSNFWDAPNSTHSVRIPG